MSVSLRQLSEACGVSTATVSRALAGHPYVNPNVREHVRQEAERLGYTRNRLVGSLMGHVRSARATHFVGNLALVHVPTRPKAPIGVQLRAIVESMKRRAGELGFAAELFELGSHVRDERALARVLRARGVTGALFLYPGPSAAPREFPWHEFSCIALDFAQREPRLNTVCHDHYVSLRGALARLSAAGYRRVGLMIERFKDERTDFRWSAAMLSFQREPGRIGRVPVLSPAEITENAFLDWFEKHAPDIVVGHASLMVGWLRARGVRVPGDVGFFNLNWEARTFACAGLDPQLELQGKVAAEALIAHVQRGDTGLPAQPRLISVPGRFVEGPTLRPRDVTDRQDAGHRA